MAISAAVGAIASGATGAAGGIIGSAITSGMAKKEARRNRRFQEYMSSTAYQRAVKDMRQAGLNPALAYGQGGASTPPGAQAAFPDLGKAVGEGTKAAGVAIQAKLAKRQYDLLGEQRLTTALEGKRARAAGNLSDAHAVTARHQAQLMKYDAAIRKLDIPRALTESLLEESKAGRVQRGVSRAVKSTFGQLQ